MTKWTRKRVPAWTTPPNPKKPRLNLGCGGDYKPGWTNVDLYHTGADERWDLLDLPWPYDDGTVGQILIDQVVEHFPPRLQLKEGHHDSLIAVLGEISRVLKVGGKALVGVPYAGSYEDLQNPTHYRRFNPGTLDFLDKADDSAYEGLHIPLSVAGRKVVRYWPKLLGRINTAYIGDNTRVPVPNVGPPQQILWCLKRGEGRAPHLATPETPVGVG